jgi:hypothetical protein
MLDNVLFFLWRTYEKRFDALDVFVSLLRVAAVCCIIGLAASAVLGGHAGYVGVAGLIVSRLGRRWGWWR